MITTNETTAARPAVQVRRVERERMRSWLGLAGPLAVAAILNFWNLTQNGYANLFYSVAVKSMLQSWHNFFFASYDAGGFISVDKPPVALWVQTISAKLLGFSPFAILLPEALAGVADVALVYYLVRRLFGTLAGFVAALALALTPIAVAVDRDNQTDTLLALTLLLAAWAITRATEKGRFALLALGLALVGVGFNIKMLDAFIVLPTFYLLYLVAARVSWPKRIGHLALGTLVLAGVSLSWPLAVDLTPPDQRPWVGGSQTNSVLELALGYNGLGRVTGQGEIGGGRGGFGGPRSGFGGGAPGGGIFNFGGSGGGFPGAGNRSGFNNGNGIFDAGFVGPFRLFSGAMAEQWSWLFPLAMVGLAGAVLALQRRWPLEPRGQALLLWGGWTATYVLVFSYASGIFHPYYLMVLAPGAAALVGIGAGALWTGYCKGGWQAWLLPVGLLVTAIWQLKVMADYPQWAVWLTPLTLGGSSVAAVPLVATRLLSGRVWRRVAPGLLGVGLLALLIAPAAWSLTPVMAAPSNASLPEAGPATVNRSDPSSWTQMSTVNTQLLSYLETNTQGYFYLLAVNNSQQAPSLELASGKPVLAAFGFMGSDPAMSPAKLAEMVATKQVRFVMGLTSGGFGGRGGYGGSGGALGTWITQNCSIVDPSQYGGQAGGATGGFGFGNAPLYDCAPQAALVP